MGKKSSKMAHLLLKGGHAWYKQHGRELNSSLHVEVRSGQRLQELLEGLLEEGIILILTHLQCQDGVSSESPRKLLKMQNLKFLCVLCVCINSRKASLCVICELSACSILTLCCACKGLVTGPATAMKRWAFRPHHTKHAQHAQSRHSMQKSDLAHHSALEVFCNGLPLCQFDSHHAHSITFICPIFKQVS